MQDAVPLGRHRLHGQVDGGVRGDGGGVLGRDVDGGVEGVVGVGDLLDGGDVRAGPDDLPDGGRERADPARVDRADHALALGRADLQYRGVGGQPLSRPRQDRGDLARDGTLQEVAALPVSEDGRGVDRGGHRAAHGPHGRGGHRDHGHGQHQPALGTGETHREIELVRRLEFGEGLLAELHG